MTILFDKDIITAVESGEIVISDFTDDPSVLGPNSYNVRLGHWFYLVEWAEDGPYYIGPIFKELGEQVLIPVRGTLLAMTIEVIGTTGDIVAEMKSRSTTGREGITVCKCAGWGDVGYVNHWTMELTAFTTKGRPFLVVGKHIAQMAFFRGEGQPTNAYQGQYRIDDWPLCMVPEKYRDRIIPYREGGHLLV